MEKNSLQSLNVSNTWNIPRIHKKILIIWYNYDADKYIVPKGTLPNNE